MKWKQIILVSLAGACGTSGLADVAVTNSLDKFLNLPRLSAQ